MRKVLCFAGLVATCFALPACNGEEFAPVPQRSADDEDGVPTSGPGAPSAGGGSGSHGAGSGQGGTSDKPPTKPSAGSSSAGTSAAAGSPGAGGSGSPGGGGMNPDCTPNAVHFKLLPGPKVARDLLCDASCGGGWLTITDAAGASAFSIFPACGIASCDVCKPLPCAAGVCVPMLLGAEGQELAWDGTVLMPGTCQSNLVCQQRSCMPPGSYRAKACVAISADSDAMTGACTPKDGAQLCAEAEFELPGTAEVNLILQD